MYHVIGNPCELEDLGKKIYSEIGGAKQNAPSKTNMDPQNGGL